MLKQVLTLVGLTLSLSTNAALLIESEGQLLGATGVEVGDSLFDVMFMDGSCNSLFEDCTSFTFTSESDARAAALAILEQVILFPYRGRQELVNGIDVDDNQAYVYTPFAHVGDSRVLVYTSSWSDALWQNGAYVDSFWNYQDMTNYNTRVYAVWTPSTVPLPGTALLVMLGMVVMAGAGAGRKFIEPSKSEI